MPKKPAQGSTQSTAQKAPDKGPKPGKRVNPPKKGKKPYTGKKPPKTGSVSPSLPLDSTQKAPVQGPKPLPDSDTRARQEGSQLPPHFKPINGPGHGRKPGTGKAEMERRMAIVVEYLSQGHTARSFHTVIVRNRALKAHSQADMRAAYQPTLDWDVSLTTLHDYFKEAREVMKRELVIDMGAEVARYLNTNDLLLRMALSNKNVSQARLVAENRHKFLRVDPYFDAPEEVPEEGEEGSAFKLPDGTIIKL